MGNEVKMMMEMVHGKAHEQTVGDACRAVIENGTATLSPDIVERLGKVKLSAVSALMAVPGGTVESLREHVNRLHSERGEAVLDAKKSREEQGFKSAAFQLDWKHVEDLTRSIVHYEAELEKALAGTRKVPAWRDPAVEMPDDDITVICRFESEDYPVYPASHDEHGWGDGCGSCGTYTDKVTGWLHIHEAAMILDGAWKRKAVAHA